MVVVRGCRLRAAGRRARKFSCAYEGVPSQRRDSRAHNRFNIEAHYSKFFVFAFKKNSKAFQSLSPNEYIAKNKKN